VGSGRELEADRASPPREEGRLEARWLLAAGALGALVVLMAA
jgi:hypothetical protein